MLNFWKKQGPDPVNLMNWICRDRGVRRLRLLNPLFRQQICKCKLHAVPRLPVTRLRRTQIPQKKVQIHLVWMGSWWNLCRSASSHSKCKHCSQACFCNAAFFFLSVDASGPFQIQKPNVRLQTGIYNLSSKGVSSPYRRENQLFLLLHFSSGCAS